ncbi:hypothetical protein ZTR_01003 [Talaromyces verruculosus]|nr:hypothetical protein ZTR_01003 [Talaromyces verruculosus]
MRPKSRNDFTIAIICALPLEADAVDGLFDETYDRLGKYYSKQPGDVNAYINGRIGNHNVVLCYLPGMGTADAASVASSLSVSYAGVELALVVGICGGAPSTPSGQEIFLGDVIISDSVIEYDFGRQYPGGFQRKSGVKDTLGRPNREIRTLLNALKGERTSNEFQTRIQQYVDTLQQAGIRWRCPQIHDILFESSYVHKHHGSSTCVCSDISGEICSGALERNCDDLGCDKSQIIRCREDAVRVLTHIGTLASANTVMKSGHHRDDIVKKEEVIGFEMEGAGVWSNIPCIVMKGVCDYADSHKNKAWQAYAAATGASAAKAFLEYWRPQNQEADKTVIPFRRNPRFEGRGPYLDLESYQKFIETGDKPESLHNLHRPDHVNELKREGDRAPGTFEWIMQTPELKRWLDQEQSQINEPASRILWLYGRPGIGKSTLAITIIEALQKLQSFKNGTKCLAYFFCTSNNQKQKTAVAIFEALIYQFIMEKRQLIGFLPPDLKKIKENLQDFDTMWDVLMKIGNHSSTGEKYCIIDGLDECEESDRTALLRQIGITFKSNSDGDSEPKINILILSRLYPETTGLHLASKDLSLYKEMAQDIDIFIRKIIEELKEREWPRYVLEDTSRILREKAGGTFLWIGIVWRELRNKSSIHALYTLKELPKDLNTLFRHLLDDARKERQKIDLKTLEGIIILCLISHRPLSLLELAEACEILPGKDDEDRSKRVEEDVKICHLMRLTQTRTVELLHQSVREFLLIPATDLLVGEEQHQTNETRLPISELDAHALMADRCIAFLLRTFHGGAILKGSQQETNQFLSYAGAHWMHHASLAADRFIINDKIEAFFWIVSKEREAWLEWYRFHRRSERIPKDFSIFHVAARWGIGPLAEFALSQRSKSEQTQLSNSGTSRRYPYNDSDFTAKNGVTPLEEAAKAGKKEIMVILLQNTPTAMNVKPAVVEAAAANPKHGKELIECLFNKRQTHQVQITGIVREAAVRNIRKVKEILKLLPRQSEDKTEITEDVLKAAARNEGKGKDIIELLLDRLGDKAVITEDVLKAAARNVGKGKDIIELLLDRLGAKADITEDVLKAAARNEGKGKEIMELLLDLLGDKANITEDVVKIAAGNWKNAEVMALLLEKHRDQIKITKHVVRAARKTKNGEEIIGMLMLELECRSQSDGHHSFQIASWNGTIEDIKKQLLADQASASCANRWGWTPLQAASWHGNIEVVRLLLSEYTVDLSSMNHDEWTALDAAFAKNHMAIAQLLLRHDPSAAADFTPTCFSETGKSSALELGNDKLEVSYRGWGKGMVGQPGAVYADKPISPLYDKFYFEIKVISLGNGGCIAIGLAKEGFPSSVPGWDGMSWGYHGDDGRIYHDSHDLPYAEKFEVGDIIGCHLKLLSGTVEFVKNGQRLGE